MVKDRKSNTKNESSEYVFFEQLKEEGWTYIKTVVDVINEPALILDEDLRIIAANKVFYDSFKLEASRVEKCLFSKMANGRWDIPELNKLMQEILPNKSSFKGFKLDLNVKHMGRRVLLLNARPIQYNFNNVEKSRPQMILLAIEDITEMIMVAEALTEHTDMINKKCADRITYLEATVTKLEHRLKNSK